MVKSQSFGTWVTGRDADNASIRNITPVQPIHTNVPGRARFKIIPLYRSPLLKHRLESRLPGADGIRTVHGNELTSSLLVMFDRDKSLDDVIHLIADALEIPVPPANKRGIRTALVRLPNDLSDTSEAICLSSRALVINALPVTILASSPLVLLPVAFLRTFLLGLFQASPILILFTTSIAMLGLVVGKKEGWSRSDALYFAFVTASTVGYGDLRPTQKSTKMLSILIGLLGLVLTGMVTAMGVYSTQKAFERLPNPPV
jgi:voltage-gated potassium channel